MIGPREVIVSHALNLQPQVVQIDGRVVDCRIVIVVRLACDAAIDSEATAGQSSHPRKARMRADESDRLECIQPTAQSRKIELGFIEELVRLGRAAVG